MHWKEAQAGEVVQRRADELAEMRERARQEAEATRVADGDTVRKYFAGLRQKRAASSDGRKGVTHPHA